MFLKFSKMDNWYQADRNRISMPNDSRVQVAEKLDGTNRTIYLSSDSPIEVYTRNGFLTQDCDWLLPELKKIQQNLLPTEKLTIYGELYGNTINKRIDYKKPVDFKIFAACYVNEDGTRGHQFTLEEIDDMLKAAHCSIQTVNWFYIDHFDLDKIKETLDLNHKTDESHSGVREGYVISFIEKLPEYEDYDSVIYRIKYKHENFEDSVRIAVPKVLSEEQQALENYITQMHNAFKQYALNDNRIIDMISKIGLPKSQINAGKLVASVLNDAKEDFLKDNTIDDKLDKKSVKRIFNLGDTLFKRCVELLK